MSVRHRPLLFSPYASSAGFTLLEVMIALAILAMMSLAVFLSTNQLLSSKEQTEARDEREHEISLALSRMSDDLGMAYALKSPELLGSDFDGQIAFKGGEERVDFATFGNQRYLQDARESDSSEVGYYLEADPEDPKRYNLMRRQSAQVDRDVQLGGRAYVLMEDVEKLRFEYLDEKADEWKKSWDSESPDASNRLPRAVKIEIEAALPDEEEKTVFTAIAPIRLNQAPIAF